MTNFIPNMIHTIDNSPFLTIVVLIFAMISGLAIVVYFIKLLSNARAFIVNKSNSYFLANKKASQPMVMDDMGDRIEVTNSLLDLISFMVTNEVVAIFKKKIALSDLYNMSDLDTDVKSIATFVFNSIKHEIFTDQNLLLTETYLIDYITKKTIDLLTTTALTHNENMRRSNQDTGD